MPTRWQRERQKKAGQAKLQEIERVATESVGRLDEKGLIPEDDVKLTVAKLYGRGFSRAQIARALFLHIVPNTTARTDEQKQNAARKKLRSWEMSQTFRDLVYQHAVVALDMSTPDILKGVARKAKRGRVDAARLALEITGRHNPKGDVAAANVVVRIEGVPRPK